MDLRSDSLTIYTFKRKSLNSGDVVRHFAALLPQFIQSDINTGASKAKSNLPTMKDLAVNSTNPTWGLLWIK